MSSVCELGGLCSYLYSTCLSFNFENDYACKCSCRGGSCGAGKRGGGGGGCGGVSATWQCQPLAVRATCAAQTLTLAPKLTCKSARAAEQRSPDSTESKSRNQAKAKAIAIAKAKCRQSSLHVSWQVCCIPFPIPVTPCSMGVCVCALCIQVLCLHLPSLWRFSAKLSKFEHKWATRAAAQRTDVQ